MIEAAPAIAMLAAFALVLGGIALLRRPDARSKGVLMLVAAAVSRQRGQTGSNYKGLNLASFRGSSELEYGCDAAFLLDADGAGGVAFKCEKNRYGAVADIATTFDPTTQTFAPAPAGLDAFDAATPAPTRGKRGKGA